MGSGYQVEPSRATLNDLPYRDLPRPPALTRALGIHQVTVAFHTLRCEIFNLHGTAHSYRMYRFSKGSYGPLKDP